MYLRGGGNAWTKPGLAGDGCDRGGADALRIGLGVGRPGSRPNVIMVLSDDQGYGDFSCHGNPVLKTPNLDRLHDQSVRLTDFHVAPMCYAHARPADDRAGCAAQRGASSVPAGRSFMRRGIPTMAEIFAAGGYRTGHFGKWHLGDSYPNLPHQRGFQETVYLTGWGITSMADVWQNDYFDGRFRHNGVLKQYPGYCTDVWFDLAMDWMRKQQAGRRAVLSVICRPTPRTGPHWVADKYKEPYQGRRARRLLRHDRQPRREHGPARRDALTKPACATTRSSSISTTTAARPACTVFNAGMRGAEDRRITTAGIAPPASSAGRPAACDRRATSTR